MNTMQPFNGGSPSWGVARPVSRVVSRVESKTIIRGAYIQAEGVITDAKAQTIVGSANLMFAGIAQLRSAEAAIGEANPGALSDLATIRSLAVTSLVIILNDAAATLKNL